MSDVLFITGSSGFIGSALVRRCEKEGIDYVPYDLPDDIRSEGLSEKMPEGCVIVHLAGLSSNKQCEADPELAYAVNVEGTRNIVNAAHARKAKQIMLASSEWVYEGLDGVLTENRLLAPVDAHGVYAETKICAELECVRLQPLRATILRFGIVYGPRKEAGSAVESIFRAVRKGETACVGSERTARRFIHVADIVSGILAAVGREGYEVFNLTGDRLVSLRDVIDASADAWDSVNTHIKMPSIQTDEDSPSIRDAPNTLARQALNWKPEYDLERGLRSLMETADV